MRYVSGSIQNILNWCRHLYRSFGSLKHRWMVGLPCLVSQCAKLYVARWPWAVCTCVYLESCTWPMAIFTMDQRKEQRVYIEFCVNLGKILRVPHNDSTSFRGPNRESYADTYRDTLKLHNSCNCCMNSRGLPSGTTSNHSRHCWWSGNWLWDMPTGSDETSEHTPFRSQICAQDPDILPSSPSSFWRNTNGCYPHPPYSPDLAPYDFFLFSKIETERTPVWYQWVDPDRIADSAWHSGRKELLRSVPKMEETARPVSICGRELLRGWWWSIDLMVSFMIFTASVRNMLGTTT
jgi:hypothetical protein